MTLIYYVGLALVLAVAGPILLLLKKKARAGLAEKLGFIPDRITTSSPGVLSPGVLSPGVLSPGVLSPGVLSPVKPGGIWFHAVSVGEFNALRPLLEALHAKRGDIPLYVSTTTATGQSLAREKAGQFATVFYFPFDLPFATRAWLGFLKPSLVAVVETELWPGFVAECKEAHIPIMTVNGRMSPKSFRAYNRLRFFFKRPINSLACLCVQTENERRRFETIAGKSLPVVVTGNTKLDGLSTIGSAEINQLRKDLNLADDDFVLIAGSTHEGEEQAAIEAFLSIRLQGQGRKPRLIIAPRHPERFQRTFEIVESNKLPVRKFSAKEKFREDDDVYVLDGLGQLARFYSVATIAFVGGTLKPVGGHNLLEPYAYGVPTICGPNVQKTRDVFNALNELEAIVPIKNGKELAAAAARFYNDETLAGRLGARGKTWIKENQGAVGRTLEAVLRIYDTACGATAFQGQAATPENAGAASGETMSSSYAGQR